MSLLESLLKLVPWLTIATTHHSELKPQIQVLDI